MNELLYKDEAYKIIGLCMEIHKILGNGFLENVYKDALEVELELNNFAFKREREFNIIYKNRILRHKYFADFVVNDIILLEIKTCENLIAEHVSQVINYLKASNIKLGLLINFGSSSLQYKRIVN